MASIAGGTVQRIVAAMNALNMQASNFSKSPKFGRKNNNNNNTNNNSNTNNNRSSGAGGGSKSVDNQCRKGQKKAAASGKDLQNNLQPPPAPPQEEPLSSGVSSPDSPDTDLEGNRPVRPQLRAQLRALHHHGIISSLFLYFPPTDRCVLAQVCRRWRDVLYANPHFWAPLMPVINYRELRQRLPSTDVAERDACCASTSAFYASLSARGFMHVCLFGARDEDVSDFLESCGAEACHRLAGVSLRCSNITDLALQRLMAALTGVRHLEITGCNQVTEAGLWSCLPARITTLTIADCINVADDAVGAIAQLLPDLREFNLQAYHVTDSAVALFSSRPGRPLTTLRLTSCWELSNQAALHLVQALPALTTLSLSGCSKLTEQGVEVIADHLKHLTNLDLSWCSRITDTALEYVACDLTLLEELVLDR